jgi:hypothetical protein
MLFDPSVSEMKEGEERIEHIHPNLCVVHSIHVLPAQVKSNSVPAVSVVVVVTVFCLTISAPRLPPPILSIKAKRNTIKHNGVISPRTSFTLICTFHPPSQTCPISLSHLISPPPSHPVLHCILPLRSVDDARLATRTLSILHAVCDRYPSVQYTEYYNDALNDFYMNSREVSTHTVLPLYTASTF